MKNEVYETYQSYRILQPTWYSTNSKYAPYNATPKAVSKYYWHLCKLLFWWYRMNYETGFLVQMNKWTRAYHFTEDWQGLHSNIFEDAKGILKGIAGIL